MTDLFAQLAPPYEDQLHGVMARYDADPRQGKIDLGVGVYRDATGRSPIMAAARRAAATLARREDTKAYLPLRGHERFLAALQTLALGRTGADRTKPIQTPGGTGAIWLALALVRLANPHARVLIGAPTWPNHINIVQSLGLEVVRYRYFDQATQALCVDDLMAGIESARAGDAIILHGPCHNPTGADLGAEQFGEALRRIIARGIIPIIDAAYCGLNAEPSEDFAAVAAPLAHAPEAFLAVACSKTFSLYRERTGALFLIAATSKAANRLCGHAEMLGRAIYSMPPAHGAAIVAEILGHDGLRASWLGELAEMRARISALRRTLAASGDNIRALAHVGAQRGIFSLLPLSSEDVGHLASAHAIHMPASGRINIAGLKRGDEAKFIAALGAVLG